MDDIILELNHVNKSFGDTSVLKDISLRVKTGEFITLLGPSGCGKTTTLRIIAGLEDLDSGEVILEGENVANKEPNLRNVNTVFQNYALFPHMTVAKNIAYSQNIKSIPFKDRKEHKLRVDEDVNSALELVQLSGYGNRMPSQLSGGQRQRVAIARAIINQPKVLLLDEPLGALDLQLRHQMQIELKTLQQNLGITFVYITHDQEEALNMSDRIVVMKNGRFEQIGSPSEIYNNPKTSFVADFVGRANLVKGKVSSIDNEEITLDTPNGVIKLLKRYYDVQEGQEVTFAVRSEYTSVLCPDEVVEDGYNSIEGIVTNKSFSSGSLSVTVKLGDGSEFTSSQHGISCPITVGQKVVVSWTTAVTTLVDLEVLD